MLRVSAQERGQASVMEPAQEQAVHEIIHEHGASPDLPTARASDLPTPANVMEAETSPHANIW